MLLDIDTLENNRHYTVVTQNGDVKIAHHYNRRFFIATRPIPVAAVVDPKKNQAAYDAHGLITRVSKPLAEHVVGIENFGKFYNHQTQDIHTKRSDAVIAYINQQS